MLVVMISLVIFTGSATKLVENSQYGRKVNISSCVTGLDKGATCDLATFPTSQAILVGEVNYCCSLPLTFQEFGVCGETGATGRTRYNVPVCHTYSRALNGGVTLSRHNYGFHWCPLCAGTPDRYNKIDLECAGNCSLVMFKQLQRAEIDCMLEELMKEDWDNSQYCLRSDGNPKFPSRLISACIAVSTVLPCILTGGGDWRPVWRRSPSWTGSGRSVLARRTR